jgi:hypothetical protein
MNKKIALALFCLALLAINGMAWAVNSIDVNIASFTYFSIVSEGAYNESYGCPDSNATISFYSSAIAAGDRPLCTLSIKNFANESFVIFADENISDIDANCYPTLPVPGADLNLFVCDELRYNSCWINMGYGGNQPNTYYMDLNCWMATDPSIVDFSESTNYMSLADVNSLTIQFYDENTELYMAPTTLTLNGTDVLGYMDENGYFAIALENLSTGYYTIKASKAGYTEREWTIYVTALFGHYQFYKFALLPTSMGRDVPFEFYLPDTITQVATTLVTVRNKDGNFISSIISSNALGQVQFFLNAQDENYEFDFNYASTLYAYGETLVTVKIPKDEQTLALINPWNLTVDGITFWDFNGLTTDKNVYVFSDLYGYHYFDVNAENYFERSYALRFKGGVATYVLQPYLVNQTTGLNVAFYFVNDLTGAALGDVTMILKKNIPGEGFVTVESVESDDAGKVVISAVYNNRYTAFFYYNGTLIKTNDYLMNSSTYTVALVLWGITYHDPTRSGVYVTFTAPYIVTYTTDYNIQGKLYADFAGVSHVNTFAKYNGTTIASFSKDLNANAIGSTDLNALIIVSGLDYNTSITIIWTIEATLSDGNTIVSSQAYTFRITGSTAARNDFLTVMSVQVPASLGCPVGSPCPILIIISLFVALACVGLLSTTIHVDFTSLSIIAVAVLGFFVMTNWVPFGLWIILCLAAGLTTIASRRVLK